jgi:hypothetical protein
MLITDRSSIEADWRCSMERYWLTEWRQQGHESDPVGGIVPVHSVFDLALGARFADGVALLTQGDTDPIEAIEVVAMGFEEQWGWQQAALLRGLLYGSHLHILPRLRIDYDILGVEQEVFYSYKDELLIQVKPDITLKRKSDGTYWTPDWKTTSWKDIEWLLQWPFAIQMQLQPAAVRQTLGLDVQGSIVFGAYKGYRDDESGREELRSPFVWYYSNGDQFSPKWLRGWTRHPVTDYPGGIYAWVQQMKDQFPTILAEQYPISQPIPLRQDMLDQFCEERLYRERAIALWSASQATSHPIPRAATFEHRTSRCKRCPYKEACWSPTIGRNPLESGLYVERTPHHALLRMIKQVTPGRG